MFPFTRFGLEALAAPAPPGRKLTAGRCHAIACRDDPPGQQLRLTEQQYARFSQQLGLAIGSLPTAAMTPSVAAALRQQGTLTEQT